MRKKLIGIFCALFVVASSMSVNAASIKANTVKVEDLSWETSKMTIDDQEGIGVTVTNNSKVKVVSVLFTYGSDSDDSLAYVSMNEIIKPKDSASSDNILSDSDGNAISDEVFEGMELRSVAIQFIKKGKLVTSLYDVSEDSYTIKSQTKAYNLKSNDFTDALPELEADALATRTLMGGEATEVMLVTTDTDDYDTNIERLKDAGFTQDAKEDELSYSGSNGEFIVYVNVNANHKYMLIQMLRAD